jgi:hypothetical protein
METQTLKRKINQAQNFKSDQIKNCKINKHFLTSPLDGFETNDHIRKFNEMMKDIQAEHQELREETEHFKQFNKKIEKRKEDLDKKQPLKVNTVEKTFAKLIHNYKQRGYRIPDLSPRKNLFKPSPLLLENSKIIDYYRFFCKDKENDKNQYFVDKVGELVTARKMQNEIDAEFKETARHKIIKNRLSIAAARRSSILQGIIDEKDMSQENLKLEKENLELRKNMNMQLTSIHNETNHSLMTNSFRSSKRPSENHGRRATNSSLNMTYLKNTKYSEKTDLPQSRGSFLKPILHHTSSKNFKHEIKNENINDPIKTEDRLLFIETAGSTNYTSMKNTLEDKSMMETQNKLGTPTHGFKKLPTNNSNISPKSNNRSPQGSKNLMMKKKMSKFRLNTEENFFPKINEKINDTAPCTETRETRESTQPTHRDYLDDKTTFLENYMSNFNLDKMNLNDLKDISTQYCKKFLNLSDYQAEEKIDK